MDKENIQNKTNDFVLDNEKTKDTSKETSFTPEVMEPEDTEMLAEQELNVGTATDPGFESKTTESSDIHTSDREIEELHARIAQLERELAEEKDHKLRILADFDNLRKRSVRDIQNATAKATSDIVVEFLPVFDHLEMAVEHGQEHGQGDGLVEGVNMVLKQFRNMLAKFGIQEINALGKPFDPNVHEAMAKAPSDVFAAGIVSKQWQKGFMLGERLIRPCRVVVSTGPEVQESESLPVPPSEAKPTTSEFTMTDKDQTL